MYSNDSPHFRGFVVRPADGMNVRHAAPGAGIVIPDQELDGRLKSLFYCSNREF